MLNVELGSKFDIQQHNSTFRDSGGEPGRDRTYDQLVKSQLLYH
jgi:hypothetical protein